MSNNYNLENEIEKILKNNSEEEIVLHSNGEPVRFKNLGLVEHKGELYTILSCLDNIHAMSEGDKMIMNIVKEKDGKMNLYLQTSERLISKVVRHMDKLDKHARASVSGFEAETYESEFGAV